MNKIIFTNPGPHHLVGKAVNQVRDNYRLTTGELEKKFHVRDWNVNIAKQVSQRFNKVRLECWFYDKHITKEKTMSDGTITYRFFPATLFFNRRSFSLPFIDALIEETKNHNVLVHLNDYHSYQSYLLLRKLKDVPVIAQYHGLGPPKAILQKKKILYGFYPLLLTEEMVEKTLFSHVDHFLTTQYEREYLKTFISMKNISVLPTPADYSLFKPMDKIVARQALRNKGIFISDDAKVALYVGRFFTLKRADLMLTLYEKLRAKYPSFTVMMIGGKKEDDLYTEVKRSGVIAVDQVPHDDLPLYFNASDVFVYYASESMKKHAGMGVAPAEALACNVPLVSTNIQNVPDTVIQHLGVKPNTEKEFFAAVERLLFSDVRFPRLREIGEQYFSYDAVYGTYIDLYKRFFQKYYDVQL